MTEKDVLHEEEAPNVSGVSHVIEDGDEKDVQMILGDRTRVRYAGIIRAGVKTLRSNASAEDKAKFKKLEEQGLPYDEIDRKLGGEPRSRKSKLFPRNVDHFVVRECDFKNPSDAKFIRENYADPDGHVRSIPIWFTQDDISTVIPHSFRAFDGGGKVRASSFYDGHTLKFRYLDKKVKEPKESDWKIVDTEDPDEVTKLCGYKVQFGGLYKVNVVGLKTFGEVVVPTRSWYGLGNGVATLKLVRDILGRFNGLVNGKHFLLLKKVPEKVKTPDNKTATQHIITIDADVDPMELARFAEQASMRGAQAVNLLNDGGAPNLPSDEQTHSTATPSVAPEAESRSQGESDASSRKSKPAGNPDIEDLRVQTEDWLRKYATEPLRIDWDDFEFFVGCQYHIAFDDMDKEQLKELYTDVRERVGTDDDRAEFLCFVNDVIKENSDNEQPPTDDGLPDLPFND